MPQSVASDLGLHFLNVSHKKDTMHICVNHLLVDISHDIVFPHSLKKGQGAGQKRALFMREIHPKGHFC